MTYIAVKKNTTVLLFMIYICHSTLMLPCLPTHLGVFYIIRLNFNRYDDVGAVATYRSDQQEIFSLIISLSSARTMEPRHLFKWIYHMLSS